LRLAVGGGGTGGHAIPALAICRAIRFLRPDVEILYIGARASLEERLARQEGYTFKGVPIAGFRRGSLVGNLTLPVKCVVALCQAMRYLSVHKIRLVIGTGGFSAWPVCAAARLSGRPYVLQEQNAYPGMVTRLMARGARRIYLGLEAAADRLKVNPKVLQFTGNPVSGEITPGDARASRRELGLDPERPTILITGGSGGAQSINSVIAQIKSDLIDRGFNLIWQTGKHWSVDITVSVEYSGRLLIERFLEAGRMAAAYRAADVAVARCGAMTLAELAAMRLPAVLVPFPYAAGGHQEANARAVEAVGAAKMILDRELTPESLINSILEVAAPETKRRMATAFKKLARTDAAEQIAKDILSIIDE